MYEQGAENIRTKVQFIRKGASRTAIWRHENMTQNAKTLNERYPANLTESKRQDRYTILRELIFGGVYLGVAFLLGCCRLPFSFSTLPLGLALLCASSAHSWYILSGLLLSTVYVRDEHPIWVTLTVYAVCVLLRIGMLYFIDAPHKSEENSQKDTAYLSRCWKSFKKIFSPHSPAFKTDDIRADYYPGAMFVKDPPAEREPDEETIESPPLLFCENIFLRMLTGVVCAFGWGASTLIRGGFQIYDLIGTLLLLIITPIAVFLFAPAFSREGERLLFIFPAKPHTKIKDKIKYSPLSTVSVSLLLFALTYSARDFYIGLGTPLLTLQLAPTIAFTVTLLFAHRMGFVPGILAAILSGLAASPPLTPILIIACAIFTLVSAASGKLAAIGASSASLVFAYFYGGLNMLVYIIPPALLSAPLIALCDKISHLLPTVEPTVEEMNDFTAAVTYEMRVAASRARIESLSDALSSLSELFYSLSDQLKKPRQSDVEQICTSAFEMQCRTCPQRRGCAVMREATEEISAMAECDGRIDANLLCHRFSEGCGQIHSISEEICRAYASISQSTAKSEKTEVYGDDYSALSMLLRETLTTSLNAYRSDRDAANAIYDYLCTLGIDVRGVAVCGERIARVVVRGTRFERFADKQSEICAEIERICGKRLSHPEFENDGDGSTVIMRMHALPSIDTIYSGSTACATARDRASLAYPLTNEYEGARHIPPTDCGDHIAIFTTEGESAYFYAIISDGMGSGKKAASTSGICTLFLEKMLSAGSGAKSALHMLNGVIRSKNQSADDECSSTVDLFELDLMNGHATFAKNGAAPTYVVREGTVFKLCTRSVPIGILKDTPPHFLKFRMRPDDVVVMVSDGVTLGNDECPWLIDLLSDTLPPSMDSLRLDILRRAIASGSDDDLSAIAVRIKEINKKE